MRLYLLTTLLFFAAAFVEILSAEPLKDENAVGVLVQNAMKTLGTKGVRGVFETVAPYWTRTKTELEAVISDSEMTRERSRKQNLDGKFLGFEKIHEKKLGESLLMIVMLEKNEKRGIPWYFSFYRPKDTWILW